MQEADLNDRQKKLLFRAWHRGTREMDIMYGRFAETHIGEWDELYLDLFEDMLDENDPDIYDWVIGRTELPMLPIRPLLEQMRHFYAVQS